jgi:NAD(P)-dependent dehydrogenase (short-subunit alcohol dehydrogenase family)
MTGKGLLISTGNLTRKTLAGQVAIVTGGGKGIGFEAARALAWLGAIVFIAEIDKIAGKAAALSINEELGNENTTFFYEDVGDEGGIEHLKYEVLRRYGRIDIVLNNATIAPLGAVKDKPISDWDRSYRVNLRGPALLAKACLPDMLKRNYGVFVCVSSFGGPYMAAYECFKRAQVVLADILAEELEGTGVIAFTIGPGQAPTATLKESIEVLAPLYGKTPQEFLDMNREASISVEQPLLWPSSSEDKRPAQFKLYRQQELKSRNTRS